MKFNKINKFFIMLSLVSAVCMDTDAMIYRRIQPVTTGLPTNQQSVLSRRGFDARRLSGRRHHRKGVICRKVAGCRKVVVNGTATGRRHHAVVCKGTTCQRAVIHRKSRRFVPRSAYHRALVGRAYEPSSTLSNPRGVVYTD